MRKEKQIEEMAKQCPFYEKGKCILLEEKEVECDVNCDLCDFAKSLYNAGYRKQSENLVEVVRCYDCKYCEVVVDSIIDEPKYFCARMVGSMPIDPTDYCSRAKMKGGADE